MRDNKVTGIIYWILCAISAIIILVIMGEDGPVLSSDSGTFIDPPESIISSYPIYTFFLAICKNLFGEERYLYLVYILQSLFAFVSSLALSMYISRYFELNKILAFVIYLFSFLPYGYSLPGSVVNHHILTEAIAFPLFSIYMIFVFKVFLEEKRKYMLGVGIITILLVLTRSQLILLIPIYIVFGLILIFCEISKRVSPDKRNYLMIGLLCLLVTLGAGSILFIGKIVAIAGNSQFADAIMGRVMCAIDAEDRELFSGEEQEIFDILFTAVEGKKSRSPYFCDGIWKWEDILVATNTNTKMYRGIIADFYSRNGETDVSEKTSNSIEIIASKLFYYHFDEYIEMSLHLFAQSFVAAIFIHPNSIFELCYFIAFSFYGITVFMLWYANYKIKINRKYSIPLLLTLTIIIIMVIITNLVFFGLQRYVVYAFGCYYISCLIFVVGIYREYIRLKIWSINSK